MRRLVVLRPEPGASATIARARAMGLDAIAMPLFAVRPLPWQAPGPEQFDALLLTSANAVRHGGEKLARYHGLPVRAVGAATAAAARAAGFTEVAAGDGDVESLLRGLPAGLRLLHLCGRDRREAASHAGVAAIPVYAAEPLPRPASFEALSGSVAAVHSPRAAMRLAELAAAAGLDRATVRIAAISAAAARACGEGWERIESAGRPSDEALLALAARLCDDPFP